MAATVSARWQKQAKRRGRGTPHDEAAALRFGQWAGEGRAGAVAVRRGAEDVGALGHSRADVGDVDGQAGAAVRRRHPGRRAVDLRALPAAWASRTPTVLAPRDRDHR